MLYTLAAVIVLTSILVFFSQEFMRFFKKIAAIKGLNLLLPLLLASCLVFMLHDWVLFFCVKYKQFLIALERGVIFIIPLKQYAAPIAMVIILTGISVLPVYFLDKYIEKQTFYKYKYPYITSTLVWVITAYLLVIF